MQIIEKHYTYHMNRSDEDLLSRKITNKIMVSKVENFISKDHNVHLNVDLNFHRFPI